MINDLEYGLDHEMSRNNIFNIIAIVCIVFLGFIFLTIGIIYKNIILVYTGITLICAPSLIIPFFVAIFIMDLCCSE